MFMGWMDPEAEQHQGNDSFYNFEETPEKHTAGLTHGTPAGNLCCIQFYDQFPEGYASAAANS